MKPFDHTFTAGGKEYVLRYSFQARRNYERKTGKSVPGILKRLTDPETQTADELIEMFLLLLSSKQPDITQDQIGQLIDDMGGEDEAMSILTNVLAPEAASAHP